MRRYLVFKLHKEAAKEHVNHVPEGFKEAHKEHKHQEVFKEHNHQEVFKELPRKSNKPVKFDDDFIDDFLLVKSLETPWSREKLEYIIANNATLKEHCKDRDILQMLACIVHMELNHNIKVSEEDLPLIHKLASNKRYMEMVFVDMSNDISSAH